MIIRRYLANEIFSTLIATATVLLFIFLSNQFVKYLHSAMSGELSSHAVTLLLMLQIPILAAVVLPLSLFLAILFAYGRLYADSEMTIFSACGISSLRLLTMTLGFSSFVILVVAALSFWVNPRVYNYSDHIRSGSVLSPLETLLPNRFNPIAQSPWIIYVENAHSDNKQLGLVFLADQNDATASNGPVSAVVAKSAYQRIDEKTGDTYLVFADGYRYTGVPGQQNYEVIKYDEYGVHLQQKPDAWQADASSIPTLSLWGLRHNKLAAAELQWRIALPFSVFVLTLLGTPLSRIKPRHGRYAQLIPAIFCYIIYANFLFLARAWMKSGAISPAIGMWWVHGVMILLAFTVFGFQVRCKK